MHMSLHFFSVGTCVSGIRKRDHQDGERLDLLKTAMCMIVHEKCPKIYSTRANYINLQYFLGVRGCGTADEGDRTCF